MLDCSACGSSSLALRQQEEGGAHAPGEGPSVARVEIAAPRILVISVIPAKAGIHVSTQQPFDTLHADSWVPAFAGMTVRVANFPLD